VKARAGASRGGWRAASPGLPVVTAGTCRVPGEGLAARDRMGCQGRRGRRGEGGGTDAEAGREPWRRGVALEGRWQALEPEPRGKGRLATGCPYHAPEKLPPQRNSLLQTSGSTWPRRRGEAGEV